MAEILITNRLCNLDSLDDIHDMQALQLQYQNRPRTGPPILQPYRPYLHSSQPSAREQGILATLDIHGLKKDVADMAMDLGERMPSLSLRSRPA
jgi:hypothetical protein